MKILQSCIRFVAAVFLVMLISPWACNPLPQEIKPNVIIVLTDDQGYGDLSCHGNPVLKTPNLDQLRTESVRFTDFHVSAMCTPSRGQILTGIDAFRNGATCVSRGRSLIQPGLPTLADLFSVVLYSERTVNKALLPDRFFAALQIRCKARRYVAAKSWPKHNQNKQETHQGDNN